MRRANILIMGAAGRDFHNFNVCFRNDPSCRVVAFTATQIPYIASRRYPASLAGSTYPRGIPIYPEEMLEELIKKYRVDKVIFAYSDVPYTELMHKASRVLASGADFQLLGPAATMLKSRRPVIAVSAVRTGCGKSEVTRYLCDFLRDRGVSPVVVRHPMPYGELSDQTVERFEGYYDLDRYNCSIEEREEFEPLLEHDAIVYAGVDYGEILRQCEKEGRIIIWDGGNNDFPFYSPDLEITLVDPLRAGDETSYYPGEVNLRRADIVVVNKVNAAHAAQLEQVERTIAAVNPAATTIRVDSRVSVPDPASVRGKDVLVIEDGPTVTHGSMSSGAGLAAAMEFGAARVIDPRPYAVGSIAEAFRRYPHIGPVLPALGYRREQMVELRRTIEAVPCHVVLSATPVALDRIMTVTKPFVRVTYDIVESADRPLQTEVARFLTGLDM